MSGCSEGGNASCKISYNWQEAEKTCVIIGHRLVSYGISWFQTVSYDKILITYNRRKWPSNGGKLHVLSNEFRIKVND